MATLTTWGCIELGFAVVGMCLFLYWIIMAWIDVKEVLPPKKKKRRHYIYEDDTKCPTWADPAKWEMSKMR